MVAFAPCLVFAQLQLGVLGGIHNSQLFNKSDKAADAQLDYMATYKKAIGLDVGISLLPQLELHCFPQIYDAGQKFVGVPLPKYKTAKQEINIELQYINLPLVAKLFMNRKTSKFRHNLQFGGYYSGLLKSRQRHTLFYTDELFPYKSSTESYNDNTKVLTTTVVQNNNGSDSITLYTGNYDEKFFNNGDFGGIIGYGINYSLSKQINLLANIQAKVGMAQVDNLDSISITQHVPNAIPYIRVMSDLFYARNSFPFLNTGGPPRDVRSTNRSLGFQLGFNYIISKHKK